MDVGVNIGYSHTKGYSIVSGMARQTVFPSVVGSPDRTHFDVSFSGNGRGIRLEEPVPALVGKEAVLQSRFENRYEDQSWVGSQDWLTLALAALSELTKASAADLTVVTGLPVAYLTQSKDTAKDALLGDHRVKRVDRPGQTLSITSVTVIPEPYGSLFDLLWDNAGRLSDRSISTEAVGIIDIGGKTTNLLSVRRIQEVGKETTSVPAGAWDIVRAVRSWLEEECPGLDLRDHQIIDAIIDRRVKYNGSTINLSPIVNTTARMLARQIIGTASQFWNRSLASFDRVLITGGGAKLLGENILEDDRFPHAQTVTDPVLANARGFFKYARFLANQ